MSIFQTADGVLAREPQGAVGDWAAHGDFDRWMTGWNSYPQAKQVTTVTVTDQGDDDDVIITIGVNGVTYDITINTGTGLALAAIGAALAAEINAHPVVRGSVVATFLTATLTLTGIIPGEAFTVSIASDPDSVLSAVTAVTVADLADAVPIGRAIVSRGYDPGNPEELVALPVAALFTAQVITATVVQGVATTRGVRVYEIRDGVRARILVDTVFAGSATEATEVTNIVAAVELAAPANTVVAADGAGDTVTFTAEVPGMEIEVEIEQVNAGDITFAQTTGPSISTSLVRAFRGVSMRPQDEEAVDAAGDPVWPANAGLRAAQYGKLFVESAETPVPGGTVYVETAAGNDTGQLYAASSATRIALPSRLAAWERDGRDASANLAVVRLNVP